jgi:hypothetical protein
MDEALFYGQPLLNLFAGEYGEDIYDNITLEGPKRGKRELMACLCLYADREIRFLGFHPKAPTHRETRRRVQRLTMAAIETSKQHTRIVRRRSVKPEEYAEVLWMLASARTQLLNLPVAFVMFSRAMEGRREAISFWYSRMVPGDWLWEQFKKIAN